MRTTHAPSKGFVAVGAPQPSCLAFFAKAVDESPSLTVFFVDEDSPFLLVAESPPRVVVSERTDLAVVCHTLGQPWGMHASRQDVLQTVCLSR